MKQEIKKTAAKGVRWSLISSVFTGLGYLFMLFVLARMLPKEVFGIFAIANIAAGLANMGADFGFGQAIVQKQTNNSNELSSLFWVNIFFAVTLLFLGYPTGLFLENFYGISDLASIILLTMLSTIPNAFGLQFYYLLQKNLKFKEIAWSEMAGNFGLILSSIFLAYQSFTIGALVGGLVIGKTIQAVGFFLYGRHIHQPKLFFSRASLKEYWHFGTFQTGRSFLVYLAAKSDALIIGKVLGSSILGIYEVIKDLLIRPIALVNPVISKVAFPLLAQQQKEENVFEAVFEKTLQIFNGISAFLFGGAFFFASFLVHTILGQSWLEYEEFVRLLSFAYFLHFSVSPMGNLITAKGQPERGFYWNILNLSLTIIAIISGSFFALQGILYALILLNFIKINLAYRLVINKLSKLKYSKIIRIIFLPILIAAVTGFLASRFSAYLGSSFITNSIGVVVYLLLYGIFSSYFNPSFFKECRTFILSWKK